MNDDTRESDRVAPFSVADLDYALPEGLIAQKPPARREDARLLVVDPPTGGLRDARIVDLPELLAPDDLLVLNDTKVLPAKFAARRMTGGAVPGLFLLEEGPGTWRVMLRGSRRLRPGETLRLGDGAGEPIALTLAESYGDGVWLAHVDAPGSADEILSRIGRTPLPPYIHRDSEAADLDDRQRYQTVYAKRPGAIAAPTAGLHLTEALLDAVRARGIEITTVTLHVGVGTFKPIAVDCLSDHVMHTERYELPAAAADAVRACRHRGGRVVAVGTTSVRVLESAAVEPGESRLVAARQGTTELFITPPYRFRVVDAMLTNFHLPRTTLLALVMAMAGVDNTRRAYRHAVEERYRFYSFGDAMLITSRGL
ncbi:MAG: tRNA preQ1(34) S-adenosylmethionine ribosyltransferase-isomerase QueA [Planctomycetota bacterium]